MSPTSPPSETNLPAYDSLRRLLHAQHDAAAAALGDSAEEHLDAVAWISAHVAAVERVLQRKVRRAGPAGARLVREQREIDRRLLRAVWRLDRNLTGDVMAAAAPTGDVLAAVRELLEEHAGAEQRLLAAMGNFDDAALSRVRDDFADAMLRAPTRPHPSAAGTVAWAAAFRLASMVDRVRDALDARHVPVARPQHPRPLPGRWGLYALGAARLPAEPPEESIEDRDVAGAASRRSAV